MSTGTEMNKQEGHPSSSAYSAGYPPNPSGSPSYLLNPSGPLGYSPSSSGYPPDPQGYPSNTVDYTPNQQGYPSNSPGYSANPQSYPPNTPGYPPDPKGYPSNAKNYPPNPQSYPFNPPGYPPNPPGYPPNPSGLPAHVLHQVPIYHNVQPLYYGSQPQPGIIVTTQSTQSTIMVLSQPVYKDYLAWSVVSLIFCNLILGIVAFIFSSKTRHAVRCRDSASAAKYSRTTLGLNGAALALGIVTHVSWIVWSVIWRFSYHSYQYYG